MTSVDVNTVLFGKKKKECINETDLTWVLHSFKKESMGSVFSLMPQHGWAYSCVLLQPAHHLLLSYVSNCLLHAEFWSIYAICILPMLLSNITAVGMRRYCYFVQIKYSQVLLGERFTFGPDLLTVIFKVLFEIYKVNCNVYLKALIYKFA